jgi:hypothetical protein
VAPARREQSGERRQQRAISWPQQGSPLLPSEHDQLMSQHQYLDVFGELATPTPNQQPQHNRRGETGKRKEHAPMLSSPDAKPQQWRALWSGPAIGREAKHDLVLARAPTHK